MADLEEMIEYNKGREVIYACFSRIFLDILKDDEYKMLEEVVPYIETLKTDNEEDILLNDGISGLSNFIEKYKSTAQNQLRRV